MNDRFPSDASARVIRNLSASAGWMKMLAILGFAGVGLVAFAGLLILKFGLPSLDGRSRLLGLVYLALSPIYLIPALPLYRAAREAERLHFTPSLEEAAASLDHLRVFWGRVGSLMLVGVVMGVLTMGGSLLVLLAMR